MGGACEGAVGAERKGGTRRSLPGQHFGSATRSPVSALHN